jgi:hypothetical protein
MTFSVLAQPIALMVLLVWNFAVLSAAQLTIRLIMAFSARLTLVAALVMVIADLAIAVVADLTIGSQASLATRLAVAPLLMLLTGLAGFAIARWVLRIRRLRGQVIAGFMIGVLDPHLFTLLFR